MGGRGDRRFGDTVLSVVPGGFAAYARIFHPPVPGGSFANLKPGESPLSWAAVAESRGTTAHKAMQWPSLIGTYLGAGDPRAMDHPGIEPDMGSLPLAVSQVVMEVLERETNTPDDCWFAVWEGWGFRAEDFVSNAPTFVLPHRSYFLLQGPIEAVLESVEDPPLEVVARGLDWPHHRSPNLWWPEDRAWCVATEIDFQSTYIGGSGPCIKSLVADTRLEAYKVETSDGITWDDDTINPKPEEGRWSGT